MKLIPVLPIVAGLLTSACATAPNPGEGAINLRDAILATSSSLTSAADEIKRHPKTYQTFGLRPSKATVSFDIQSIHTESNEVKVSATAVNVPVGGAFGWSASRQLQKGNHIEIEFTPRK
jgi:hypothetical protein